MTDNMTPDERKAFMLNEQKVTELEDTGEYKVLRRAYCKPTYPVPSGPSVGLATVLDTEATSADPNKAEIISVARIPVYYDKRTLEILGYGECKQDYNEPSGAIPDEVVRLTGITDDMVRGHQLDIAGLTHELSQANILVAHNASYDRVLLERYLPDIREMPWACSFQDIPWKEFGFTVSKLDYLTTKMGYFYEAHRADADCHALATLLSTLDSDKGKPIFSEMMEKARSTHYTIAGKVQFGKNDLLKAEGFTWNPGLSSWCKTVTSKEDIPRVVGIMRAISGNPRMAPYVYISTAQERYSGNLNLNRMPQTELRLCMGETPTESDALMDPWTKG